MGALLVLNTASLAILCAGLLALWPVVQLECATEMQAFARKPEMDGWPELSACAQRLAAQGAELVSHEHGRVSSVLSFLTNTGVELAQTLLSVLAQWTDGAMSFLLLLFDVSAHVGEQAHWLVYEGAASVIAVTGTSTALLMRFARTSSSVVSVAASCMGAERGVDACLLTDLSFDAAMQPPEVVWMRDVSLQLASSFNSLRHFFAGLLLRVEQPEFAHQAFRLLVFGIVVRLLCDALLRALRLACGALLRLLGFGKIQLNCSSHHEATSAAAAEPKFIQEQDKAGLDEHIREEDELLVKDDLLAEIETVSEQNTGSDDSPPQVRLWNRPALEPTFLCKPEDSLAGEGSGFEKEQDQMLPDDESMMSCMQTKLGELGKEASISLQGSVNGPRRPLQELTLNEKEIPSRFRCDLSLPSSAGADTKMRALPSTLLSSPSGLESRSSHIVRGMSGKKVSEMEQSVSGDMHDTEYHAVMPGGVGAEETWRRELLQRIKMLESSLCDEKEKVATFQNLTNTLLEAGVQDQRRTTNVCQGLLSSCVSGVCSVMVSVLVVCAAAVCIQLASSRRFVLELT